MIAIRFQEAAQVVNGILVDKFPLLLNRIIQKLHLKVINLNTSHFLFDMLNTAVLVFRLRFSVLKRKSS